MNDGVAGCKTLLCIQKYPPVLLTGFVVSITSQLHLERVEETLGYSVIPTIFLTAHTAFDPVSF
jgi:hypothetical protein